MTGSVGVIDYGMGNLHSIAKALEHVGHGHHVVVSNNPDTLRATDRLVLPGVGAIGDCMAELQRLDLAAMVREMAGKKPLLGICLGIQALMNHSAESNGTDCLDIVPGQALGFAAPDAQPDGQRRKVPHMGWNTVHQQNHHPLWRDIAQDSRFYFVHSYYVVADNSDHVAATTHYGLRFSSAIASDGVFAVQFHPEKSQAPGLQLLANFLVWDGCD